MESETLCEICQKGAACDFDALEIELAAGRITKIAAATKMMDKYLICILF